MNMGTLPLTPAERLRRMLGFYHVVRALFLVALLVGLVLERAWGLAVIVLIVEALGMAIDDMRRRR